jgi:hypothetical protein
MMPASKVTPADGDLLIRDATFRLPDAQQQGSSRWKWFVKPAHKDTHEYGTIHQPTLTRGTLYVAPEATDVGYTGVMRAPHLLHFRYRYISSMRQRLHKKYVKTGSSPGATVKRAQILGWLQELLKARSSTVPHTAGLHYVAPLSCALVARWSAYREAYGPIPQVLTPHGTPPPPIPRHPTPSRPVGPHTLADRRAATRGHTVHDASCSVTRERRALGLVADGRSGL